MEKNETKAIEEMTPAAANAGAGESNENSSMWELMRKDEPTGTDDEANVTSRVLRHPPRSIWDVE